MTSFAWNLDADGDWGTPGDWSPGGPPSAGSNVVIKTAHAHTVTLTHGDGAVSVNSLTVSDDIFNLSGGSLSIATSASFGAELEVQLGSDGTATYYPTLELNSISTAAPSFLHYGGVIDGTGTLTVMGSAAFESGDPLNATQDAIETGAGTTLLEGSTTVEGNLDLDGGRILENKGSLRWTAGNIVLGYNPLGTVGGGTIKNDAGAVFDIEQEGLLSGNGAGVNTFENAGKLEKTVDTGLESISAAFVNTGAGTVSVQAGTLAFVGGGSSSASAFTVATGATLAFDDDLGGAAGTFTITGGTYNVAGETEIQAGKADFSSATITSFGSELLVTDNGLLELGTKSTSVAAFEQSGGAVDGTGTLTVSGAATVISSDLETGAGTTLLKGVTTLNGALYLDGGRVLENKGTLDVTSPSAGAAGGQFYLGENLNSDLSVGGGTIKNDVGATFDVEFD